MPYWLLWDNGLNRHVPGSRYRKYMDYFGNTAFWISEILCACRFTSPPYNLQRHAIRTLPHKISIFPVKLFSYSKKILFLEEFSNPLRIKSLRASSKNEVMNWQPFWFLHLCIKCADVQRTYAKIRFFTEYAKHLLFFFFNKYRYCQVTVL